MPSNKQKNCNLENKIILESSWILSFSQSIQRSKMWQINAL